MLINKSRRSCRKRTSERVGGGGIGGGDRKPEAEEEEAEGPFWPGVRRLREAMLGMGQWNGSM